MPGSSAPAKLFKIVVESALHAIGPNDPLFVYKDGVRKELDRVFTKNEEFDVNPITKVLYTIDELIRKTREAIQRRTDAGETSKVEHLENYLSLLNLIRNECEKLRPEGNEGLLSEKTRPGKKI